MKRKPTAKELYRKACRVVRIHQRCVDDYPSNEPTDATKRMPYWNEALKIEGYTGSYGYYYWIDATRLYTWHHRRNQWLRTGTWKK